MYNWCHFDAFSHLLQQILLGIRANVSASITLPTFCIYDAVNTEEANWDTYDSFIIKPESNFSKYIFYFKKAIDMKNIELLGMDRLERIRWEIFNQNGSKMETGEPSESSSLHYT